ncbi:unnamed protein product [Thlaspi arvense]|uniref:Uncharacterized protein n=1 Tax=Thlaspi arvense TaxID=13288 RepID=A0AAU9T7K9_THLAR|nr:unnamed protein product [Thlaspi arvense]
MGWCFRPGDNGTIEYDVEFKIPDGYKCDKLMIAAISNIKGVNCTPDDENKKIRVTGRFNLEKMLKKLTKYTGKKLHVIKERRGR